MNDRERILTMFRGGVPDRVPWFGDLTYWAGAMERRGEVPRNWQSSESYYQFHRELGVGFYLQGYFAFRTVTDGLSNTLMVVETAGSSVPWSKPQDLDANSIDFTLDNDLGEGIGSDHPDGPRGLFVDGSARTLPYNTPASDVKAMSTIAGGEIP